MLLPAPSSLQTHPRLYRAESIGGYPVDVEVLVFPPAGGDAEVGAVRVFAGEVQEVDAREDGEEAAEEGEGVGCVGCVEAAEEDEGGEEGEGCEGYVVEGVDSGKGTLELFCWGLGGFINGEVVVGFTC